MSDSSGTILVTGGAGYVGSHTVKRLRSEGRPVVVFDDLVYGHARAVQGLPLVVGSLNDREALVRVMRENKVESVIHFAARCYVGESVREPRKYFRDNVAGSLSLLEAMQDVGVERIVFSSTCAVYGTPTRIPIAESQDRKPINPYGWSKATVEDMLFSFSAAYGLRYTSLRYFNAAGADPEGELGEWHDPETHLIPLALRAVLKHGTVLEVFGTDYPTPDGTCIRDYIHVTDLADAHVRALDRLAKGGESIVINLGTGTGFSVREVLDAATRVTGREIPTRLSARREGDPPRLIADRTRASEILGWVPRYAALEVIVEHAWNWLSQHPRGFES